MEEARMMRSVSGRFSRGIKEYGKWIESADRFDFDGCLVGIAETYPSESMAREIMGFRDEIRKRYISSFEPRMEELLEAVLERVRVEPPAGTREVTRTIRNGKYDSERSSVMRLPRFGRALAAKMKRMPHLTETEAEERTLEDYGVVREFGVSETVEVSPMESYPADALMGTVLEDTVYDFISSMHPGNQYVRSFRMIPCPFTGKDRKRRV